MELDALHKMLVGAVISLAAAVGVLWRQSGKRSRGEELLQEENERLRQEREAAKAACDASLEAEIRRTAAANKERQAVMAFIVPLITSDRLNLEPQEQAEFQRIMRGVE